MVKVKKNTSYGLNPADMERKRMKRKESKKNKMERDFSYEGRKLALNDPETLKVELDGLISIEQSGRLLNETQRLRKRILIKMLSEAVREKERNKVWTGDRGYDPLRGRLQGQGADVDRDDGPLPLPDQPSLPPGDAPSLPLPPGMGAPLPPMPPPDDPNAPLAPPAGAPPGLLPPPATPAPTSKPAAPMAPPPGFIPAFAAAPAARPPPPSAPPPVASIPGVAAAAASQQGAADALREEGGGERATVPAPRHGAVVASAATVGPRAQMDKSLTAMVPAHLLLKRDQGSKPKPRARPMRGGSYVDALVPRPDAARGAQHSESWSMPAPAKSGVDAVEKQYEAFMSEMSKLGAL